MRRQLSVILCGHRNVWAGLCYVKWKSLLVIQQIADAPTRYGLVLHTPVEMQQNSAICF